MTRRFCDDLLVAAAQRWPASVRDEMLTEWRAELGAATGPWRRLRYAGSLALARPAERRVPVVPVALSLLGSMLFINVLPTIYLPQAQDWATSFSSDTVPGQTWIGVAAVVGAVVLGLLCARMTSGTTQLITPTLAPLWTFGVFYCGFWTIQVATYGIPDRASLIDISCWALAGAVLSTWAGWLAIARRKMMSWIVTAGSALVAFLFSHMHYSWLTFLDDETGEIFQSSWLGALGFEVVINPWLHVTIFLAVYSNYLAIRWHGKPSVAAAIPARA